MASTFCHVFLYEAERFVRVYACEIVCACFCVFVCGQETSGGMLEFFRDEGGLRTGRLWSWNDKASLLFLRRAYYLILFYSNSSASSVTRRERNPSAGCPALSLSLTGHALSLLCSVSV